ncbi:MAG: hypothetical protein JWQ87_3963, partial [Candidatus Sulfotelmatobacter sp.]|nr:hypothetical protein [Candidatus Sulfotelmatobacter sp.]
METGKLLTGPRKRMMTLEMTAGPNTSS